TVRAQVSSRAQKLVVGCSALSLDCRWVVVVDQGGAAQADTRISLRARYQCSQRSGFHDGVVIEEPRVAEPTAREYISQTYVVAAREAEVVSSLQQDQRRLSRSDVTSLLRARSVIVSIRDRLRYWRQGPFPRGMLTRHRAIQHALGPLLDALHGLVR